MPGDRRASNVNTWAQKMDDMRGNAYWIYQSVWSSQTKRVGFLREDKV